MTVGSRKLLLGIYWHRCHSDPDYHIVHPDDHFSHNDK